MFNCAFLSAPVLTDAELTQRILLANAHFNARGQEWAYWVCEDWLAGRTRKRSRQFSKASACATRWIFRAWWPSVCSRRRVRCRQLDVRRVGPGRCAMRSARSARSASTCRSHGSTEVFDSDSVWRNFAGYVGYVDDEPVSTTAIVMGGGAMGVYNVATVPATAPRLWRGRDAPRAGRRPAAKRDRASNSAVDAGGAKSLSPDGVQDGDQCGGLCQLSTKGRIIDRRPRR